MSKTNNENSACEVLPSIQTIVNSLNQPTEISLDTREKLVNIQEKLNRMLNNDAESKACLKNDNIAKVYLPQNEEFKDVVTLRYVLLFKYYTVLHAFPKNIPCSPACPLVS